MGAFNPGAALPPDVSGQMGAAGGPDYAQLAASQGGEVPYGAVGGSPQGGAPNPYGELYSQAEAILAVLQQMAASEPTFSAYAQQAASTIADGLSALSSAPQGQPSIPPDAGSVQAGAPAAQPPMA